MKRSLLKIPVSLILASTVVASGAGFCFADEQEETLPEEPVVSEEEIKAFRDMCAKFGVEERIVSELEEYYRQTNNFLGYFNCDELYLFD